MHKEKIKVTVKNNKPSGFGIGPFGLQPFGGTIEPEKKPEKPGKAKKK